jgi:hypothetical protein
MRLPRPLSDLHLDGSSLKLNSSTSTIGIGVRQGTLHLLLGLFPCLQGAGKIYVFGSRSSVGEHRYAVGAHFDKAVANSHLTGFVADVVGQ